MLSKKAEIVHPTPPHLCTETHYAGKRMNSCDFDLEAPITSNQCRRPQASLQEMQPQERVLQKNRKGLNTANTHFILTAVGNSSKAHIQFIALS